MMLIMKMSQARVFSPDLERFFIQSTARLSLFYRAALFHIEENFGHLLEIDREYVKENLPRFAEAIGDIMGMAEPHKCRCWGFIDGTFRPIARPTRYQRSAYNGHYGRHGLKYQGIQRPDGIMHLFGPMAGRRHDAHMLRISGVLEELETFSFREELAEPTFYIYGDPAYPQGNKYLQRPFKGAGRTVQQELYNRRWSSVRICVEWGFREVLKEFPGLKMECHQKVHHVPVASLYRVATLLTNMKAILEGTNHTAYHFKLRPPTIDIYFRERDV
jgi:nuclease HARBI1